MTLDITMPFYGRFDQFVAAVESILGQHDPDWRLTIIDDVYPDPEPGRWAASINDPRVTYQRNLENLGVNGSFRKAVELMSGDYAVIMGCDDIMLPDFVSRHHALVSQFPNADVFQPGVEVIDDEGDAANPLADRVKGYYRPRFSGSLALAGEPLAESLARGNWAYFPSLIWRVATIRRIGFRADLEVALDLSLLFEITAEGGTFVLDDQVVFQYRRHAASVSAFTAHDGTRFVEERSVLWDASERFKQLGWTRASRIARRYVSSRLNALSVLPRVSFNARSVSRAVLFDHILGRTRKRT